MIPKIITHGGAWNWSDALDNEKRKGMKEATRLGYEVLKSGGSAMDAVEKAVRALEDNPLFDAGTGGYLNQNGVVQLDALFINGKTIDFGAVAAVSKIKNPISLARKIMEQTDRCFLVDKGAEQMAQKLGIKLIENSALIVQEMFDHFQSKSRAGLSDTVGAIAIDSYGHTASATSTSGAPFKPHGRVGDSPIFGAGGYADDQFGTVGSTGKGEHIYRLLLSKYVWDLMQKGLNAQEAADQAMVFSKSRFANPMTGVIAIDSMGNIGVAHNTPKIAVGWNDSDGTIQTAMHRGEI